MDRATIIGFLQAAENQIAIIEQEIANQCDLISSRRNGHATSRANAELLVMEQIRMQYIGDRDRLRAELAALNSVGAAKEDASIVSAHRTDLATGGGCVVRPMGVGECSAGHRC